MTFEPSVLGPALDAGFRQDSAEKVHRLLDFLRRLSDDQSTAQMFTLKGGTALNVFHLPDVPRLSVDIDLMVTGHAQASPGSAGRGAIIDAVRSEGERGGYSVHVIDSEDSGCTLVLSYVNSLATRDSIKVDLDFLNRMTLLPSEVRAGPALFEATDVSFPSVSPSELLGSKLTAVAYRCHARDVYDMYRMLRLGWHDADHARSMYLAYSFLKDHDMYRLAYPMKLDVPYDPDVLADVLRAAERAPTLASVRQLAKQTLGKQPGFAELLGDEVETHQRLLAGDATAFPVLCGTTDPARKEALARHPGLVWRLRQLERRASPRRPVA